MDGAAPSAAAGASAGRGRGAGDAAAASRGRRGKAAAPALSPNPPIGFCSRLSQSLAMAKFPADEVAEKCADYYVGVGGVITVLL